MKSDFIIKNLDIMIKNPKCSLNYTLDYELLIAVILSAQSKDERVNQITPNLFKYSLEEIKDMEIEELENIIKPLGQMKKKSIYIKELASKLINECNGCVPNNREFLESLNGVGHKTANVVLNVLFNEPTIAVDTHVFRVSKVLGITSKNDTVISTEKKLMNFFPKSKWGVLHHQLVLFGRHICKSKKPNCNNCLFKGYCRKNN